MRNGLENSSIASKYGTKNECLVLELSSLCTTGMLWNQPLTNEDLRIYRVGITVCKWLYQSLHDVHAISTFDYILPLMVHISFFFWITYG